MGSTISVYAQEEKPENIVSTDNLSATVLADVGIARVSDSENKDFEISVSEIGERSAVLSWNDKTNSKNYTIQKLNNETKKLEDYAVCNENQLVLTNLEPNSFYRFVVKARLSDKILGGVSFNTLELTPYISVADASSKFVKLSFDNMQQGSSVIIYKGTSVDDLKMYASTEANEYTDSDVDSGNTYYYNSQIIAPTGKVTQTDTVEANTPVPMGLPSVSGSTKTYAIYTAVTAKSSPQYKLLNSSECYTGPETGIRMVDDCYCVALGSYYGSTIGTKYRITFSNGNSIKVILCDQKANAHTDSNHQYAVNNQDIMEFYVQKSKIPSNIRGNYGNLPQFSGSIVSIEKYV